MPRFFVNSVDDENIIIDGEDANHIGRSLRMKPGEEITACQNGFDYLCRIEEITADKVCCKVLKKEKSPCEPNVSLTLFQAVPKLDKLETIIQKAVELGVSEIVPVLTRRCVSRPDEKTFSKKLERYNKIALEAAKQSGRAVIPEVKELTSLKNAAAFLADYDIKAVCYEKGGINFSEIGLKPDAKIALFIGSEGGFDEEEIDFLKECGAVPIWLGNRILRCETAPLAAISIIMNLTGNM
ncbi:MAG TPA: RsmE family RNA methyltransferase [Oscillospiraceae bacterium]|nr:RsmE family RNA methyltransferase [Oscillospiraceae bacterium]